MPGNAPLWQITTHPEPELIFAVVSPVGTDLESFQGLLRDLVGQFNYQLTPIRLSELAQLVHTEKVGIPLDVSTPFHRIDSLMTAGNTLRQLAGRSDVLALHAISKIRLARDTGEDGNSQPLPRTIHFLRSLKHPEEVEALRRVYGAGFFLIGLHATESEQLDHLVGRIGMEDAEARHLMTRDKNEEEPFGQHTRETFTLSDVFVRVGREREQLLRFLDLVFQYPYWTPTRDEHAMFLAHAAALRSGQLARQVGAVIVNDEGEVIATGANDVPRFGGGLYWPIQDGDDDNRDHAEGWAFDSNDREIARIIANIVEKARLASEQLDAQKLTRLLNKDSLVADLTEYGRAVHAEMEALLVCARTGVSPRHGTIYTTTFPCHNCTKHIVGAGIERLVYVEPYPKSKAGDLHPDSVAIDGGNPGGFQDKVRFEPFVGIAARRYFDLFSMRLSAGLRLKRKDAAGNILPWSRESAKPRVRMAPYSYLQREELAVEQIEYAVATMEEAAQKAKK